MDRLETKLPVTCKEKQEFMVLKSMPTVTSQQVNYNSKFWERSVACWNCDQKGHVMRDYWSQPYRDILTHGHIGQLPEGPC